MFYRVLAYINIALMMAIATKGFMDGDLPKTITSTIFLVFWIAIRLIVAHVENRKVTTEEQENQ